MKRYSLLCAAVVVLAATVAHAESNPASHATKPAKPAMDPQAMEAMMEKAATPGPQHERFKRLEGNWTMVVKMVMDPSQPPQESTGSSVIHTLMDGRYMQEDATGQMMGKPFTGMGLTGYDNVLKKYVGTWIDNSGTGIMTSSGSADPSGDTIHWTGESSDPMTGKLAHFRMVTHYTDDDHFNYDMYGKRPDGKEALMMSIAYTRQK